jgi:DNA-directed RNA polymerase I and III subunit RPAC1
MKKSRSGSKKKSDVQEAATNDQKSRAKILLHGVDNHATFEHPASFAAATGVLDPSSLKHFAQNVDIKIKSISKEEMVFDLMGAEPPLANALRRIMIAEIPTIAIEKVTMWQNTSIIPDENLAHRMGLIPLNADGRAFEFHVPGTEYTEHDCLKFRLHKICTKKDPSAPMVLNNTHDEDTLYNNANVYSGDLEWIPMGD